MAAFISLFFISLIGAVAISAAINYFCQIGISRSLGFSLLAVAVFMIFAASGLWANSSRHDWGILTPLFALMLIGAWISFRFGKVIWKWWLNKKRGM